MQTINLVMQGAFICVKKRGIYKDNLGFVHNIDDSKVTLLLVPRLSYVPDRHHHLFGRPSQALFNPNRAREVFGLGAVEGDDTTQFYKFQKSSFKGGFLECIFSFCQLVTKNVQPMFKELEIFSASLMMDLRSFARFNWYCDELLNS